jgi:putative phosphoesterase
VIRVAILADTHGRLDARVEVLVADCDLGVHGGDIGNADVLERLRHRQGRVIAVTGNNDCHRKWSPEQRHFLDNLREHEDLELPGGTLVIIHGHQIAARNRHERLRRPFPRARAIVYGHSHRLIADRDREPWVLNSRSQLWRRRPSTDLRRTVLPGTRCRRASLGAPHRAFRALEAPQAIVSPPAFHSAFFLCLPCSGIVNLRCRR